MNKEKQWPIMQALTVASLTWKRHLQKEVLPHGVTLKQLYVLRQLDRKGVLNPSEIAKMLFCDRPTATVVIKNMEKQGWVKRKLDPNDYRRIMVTLDKKGQVKLKDVVQVLPDSKGPSFDPLSCFTRSEKGQLNKLLAKLNQHLQKLNEDMDD